MANPGLAEQLEQNLLDFLIKRTSNVALGEWDEWTTKHGTGKIIKRNTLTFMQSGATRHQRAA